MEIERYGQLSSEKEYRFTCDNCKSVNRAKSCEKNGSRTFRNETMYEFTCPLCKKKLYVDANTYIKPGTNQKTVEWYWDK